MSIKVPKYIQKNAKKSLECIKKGSNAMTSVGRYRAKQLSSGKPISKSTLKKMYLFKRHLKNASYEGNYCKDKGAVAWLGWGGSISKGKGKLDAVKCAKRNLK